jgi:uncharacterized protein YyaL (SSP411 family)
VRTHFVASLGLSACLFAAAGCDSKKSTAKPAPTVSPHSAKPAHTNRLVREKSPYLLQHAHNPVDWHAWGEEAFAKARKENKPIFLSIGYSTCHWCHVMERESFEDETVAAFLNKHFISIKVDREERPDVDKIYMTAVQAMTRSGGWPLNVFLTPDLKPFYGGTYFPPKPHPSRPSFQQLLERIAEFWKTREKEVVASAEELNQQLAEMAAFRAADTNSILSSALLTNALARFKLDYEPRHGGFGNAPKFPRPATPSFVLRQGIRHKDPEAVKMIVHTCERMAAGGMYDQLGGGFARYSVDSQWLVPHFEKMLYDNAQLIHLYLDAHLVTGEAKFADTARDIIRYVLRDMTHPEGGFYSAEDADSEGHEGKFYCWTKKELASLLTPAEFSVATNYFGITEEGNFEDHSHPAPLKSQNVLSIVSPQLSPDDTALLAAAKAKMFSVRSKRVRPHLDDKVLASWNGLMLGALARAGAVLNDASYLAAAKRNLAFLQAKLWDAPSKTLHHRWRDGERDTVQLLDTHAFLLDGTLHLYEATLEPSHLDFALALAETMTAKFYDTKEGGFFQSAAGSKDLILRVKEDYDGAEPSGNSVATLALLKLAAITDDKPMRERAEKALRQSAAKLQRLPEALPYLLAALDYWLEEPRRVVIAGDPHSAEAKRLLHAAHSVYQPNKVVLGTTGAVEAFAKGLPEKDGPVVYLCTGTACQPPTNDPLKLKELLK